MNANPNLGGIWSNEIKKEKKDMANAWRKREKERKMWLLIK